MQTKDRSKKQMFWQEFIPKTWICLREGYSFSFFKKDLLAGVTVGIVALPLAMAFGIASGVSPVQGLATAIIAGFLISFLGGSRVQIGGPTGAFVVIVYEIVQRQGYDGLAIATLIAAVLLIVMGLCRLGSLIKYIPYPLVTGFTTGIALVLFSSQIKDFFGLQIATVPADFIEKWGAYFKAFSTWDPLTFALGFGTLALIILIRRFVPVVPWGITSIVIITSVTIAFDLPVETIASRFGELPRSLPLPSFPHFSFNMELLQRLIPDAITIALLAGIESLLSAVISDRMIGGRHKSNCELVAQGAANFGSILFGGIPATAAIARTAINAKTGAKTPIAGIIHAATLFLIIFLFAPLVSQIPLATLAAVLMTVAWNMSEWEQFRHLFKAPAGDIAILLTAFLLTVLVDLTVAVEAGMILAVFLFMKRMSEHSGVVPASVKFNEEEEEFFEGSGIDAISKIQVPQGVHIFEIDGPFFFGVADRLKEVAFQPESTGAIFILRMRKVPVIDASGMYALKEFYLKCQKEGTLLILSGVREVPAKNLKKFGLHSLIGEENIFPHLKPALKRAHEILKT